MGERAPERSTEGGTGRCARGGGHKVKLREEAERRVCLGKGVTAMFRSCKERGSVQRKCSLVLNGVSVRKNTSGIQAEISFTEGKPELHAQKKVVEAHRGRCVGASGPLCRGKWAQCQGRADYSREVF
jgi:hypothetical protein